MNYKVLLIVAMEKYIDNNDSFQHNDNLIIGKYGS